MTKSRWPKIGKNLIRKFSTTKLIFWTWPKFMTPTSLPPKNMLYGWLAASLLSATRKNIRHGGLEDPGCKIKVRRCQFWSNSIVKVFRCHVSVKFIQSSWCGQVNNPHFKSTLLGIVVYVEVTVHSWGNYTIVLVKLLTCFF